MTQQTMHCRVRGRVQGVFFRASTREQAERLGLAGRVSNLSDGSVEVVAKGDPASLDALREWLHRGPPEARVEEVDCAPYDEAANDTGWGTSFVIR